MNMWQRHLPGSSQSHQHYWNNRGADVRSAILSDAQLWKWTMITLTAYKTHHCRGRILKYWEKRSEQKVYEIRTICYSYIAGRGSIPRCRPQVQDLHIWFSKRSNKITHLPPIPSSNTWILTLLHQLIWYNEELPQCAQFHITCFKLGIYSGHC